MSRSANRSTTGRSLRTPAKHKLMSDIFGREVGVMDRPQFREVPGLHWNDLTAGDGAGSEEPDRKWCESCSPGILAHHAKWWKNPKSVIVDLYERAPATFESLLNNLAAHLPDMGYEQRDESTWTAREGKTVFRAHNMDSTSIYNLGTPPGWAVQVVNDPNKVSDWAMAPGLMGNASQGRWTCLAMSTMGCNVAGLKRLDREERELWYDHVRGQVAGLQSHHDLFIAAIENDAAQWAYLVTVPDKWRDKVAGRAHAVFGEVGYTLRCAWLRPEQVRFQEICDALFLRRSELKEISE